jgi:hypothetical protein
MLAFEQLDNQGMIRSVLDAQTNYLIELQRLLGTVKASDACFVGFPSRSMNELIKSSTDEITKKLTGITYWVLEGIRDVFLQSCFPTIMTYISLPPYDNSLSYDCMFLSPFTPENTNSDDVIFTPIIDAQSLLLSSVHHLIHMNPKIAQGMFYLSHRDLNKILNCGSLLNLPNAYKIKRPLFFLNQKITLCNITDVNRNIDIERMLLTSIRTKRA